VIAQGSSARGVPGRSPRFLNSSQATSYKAEGSLAGGLGGTIETERTLDYLQAGDDNRKLCSLYLSIVDRMGIKLDQFGDAETRLQRL
jgi:hypothetical protein